jgi:hypothetical protein
MAEAGQISEHPAVLLGDEQDGIARRPQGARSWPKTVRENGTDVAGPAASRSGASASTLTASLTSPAATCQL